MKTLIFSKDRPCQLYALLESIQIFDIERIFRPTVLWKHSNVEFSDGYHIVMKDFPSVEFRCQASFKAEVLAFLKQTLEYLCMFLVDDQMMRHPIMCREYDMVSLLYENGNYGTISLRLGKNTTYQYQSDCQVDPPKFAEHQGFLTWNAFPHPTWQNWGYPLSVDGHVFRTSDILALTQRLSFTNPNTFEGTLSQQKAYFSPMMACLAESVFVNNPMNLVQETHTNKHNGYYTTQQLNDMFLDGQKIDVVATLDETGDIISAHQDIQIRMTKR